jgi:D-aminopeptidase
LQPLQRKYPPIIHYHSILFSYYFAQIFVLLGQFQKSRRSVDHRFGVGGVSFIIQPVPGDVGSLIAPERHSVFYYSLQARITTYPETTESLCIGGGVTFEQGLGANFMERARIRDLGIVIGRYPTGKHNAITDIPGVLVGHSTLTYDMPRIARTGVTVILPRDGEIWKNHAFAAYYIFNGNGELTGSHWIDEAGLLTSPIGLTNTHQVGQVRDMLIAYEREHFFNEGMLLPVVAETYDGWLNDIDAFHLTKSGLFIAMSRAATGPVKEGNVGGGTGMICHDFKGGIGTSSRLVDVCDKQYTVGVLVQTNYGDRSFLQVNGVPVGMEITPEQVPTPWGAEPSLQAGSIIVVVGTDAPLLPIQCKRLAQRATVGLSRVGGIGYNSSGDIFLVFATGNDVLSVQEERFDLQMLPHRHLNLFFEAVAEAVEEAILNSLTMAETMTGHKGRTAYAMPLDMLIEVMNRYNRGATTTEKTP